MHRDLLSTFESRRAFLSTCFSASCGLAATAMLSPLAVRSAYAQQPRGEVLGRREFARVEKLADNVWALISTPFTKKGKVGNLTTHSNGGIIAGKDAVLMVDTYRTTEGGKFAAEACKFVTGRLPTHVVHTHFHFDHIGGTRGLYLNGAQPEIIMSEGTRRLAFQTYLPSSADRKDPRFKISKIEKLGSTLTDATKIVPDGSKPIRLDLGGRTVVISSVSGHTQSDLVVRDEKSGVVFAGDLIWDGIFPNFMSASPSMWRRSVRNTLKDNAKLVVPGHGAACDANSIEMVRFERLLAVVESSMRDAFKKGLSKEEAAKALVVPQTLGSWKYFKSGFHELAASAWYDELKK